MAKAGVSQDPVTESLVNQLVENQHLVGLNNTERTLSVKDPLE